MKVQNGKEGYRTVVARWLYSPTLGARIACLSKTRVVRAMVKESGEVQPGIASQADPSAVPGLISSRSSPLLCDLELSYWTALDLLHLLRIIMTKGKQAAAGLNAYKALYNCRQRQHIVQYSWKARLLTVCLPKGICEWLWQQTAPGTDAFSRLWSRAQNESSTIGFSQGRSFVKVRSYRGLGQVEVLGDISRERLQKDVCLEMCLVWFAFYQNRESVCWHISGPAQITCVITIIYTGYINVISCRQLQNCSSDQIHVATSHGLDRADSLWRAGRPRGLNRGKCLLSMSWPCSQQPTSTPIWVGSEQHLGYALLLNALGTALSNSCTRTPAYMASFLALLLPSSAESYLM